MRRYWALLFTALLVSAAGAQDVATNRLTLSARLGFNISARFKGTPAGLPVLVVPRSTPSGDPYNYDDGYVLIDSSGNFGGQTWYWGYDNSSTYPAGQISDGSVFPGNTVLLSRTNPNADFSSPSMDDDVTPGVELAYSRWLGQIKGAEVGFELAASWQTISMRDGGTFFGSATRLTDAYAYTPGTRPPTATPDNPYQGAFGDEGFLLADSPIDSATETVRQAVEISGNRRYEADLWGFRLGPYISIPIADRFDVLISGGLAVGLLDGEASWSDTISMAGYSAPSTGNATDFGVLWGGYFGASLCWTFNDHWSAVVGAQYQNLGTHESDFGGRRVEVDLSDSFFLTLGVSYSF